MLTVGIPLVAVLKVVLASMLIRVCHFRSIFV